MCVAIYKPAGVKALDKERCMDCWDTNPDGAGFAWRRKDGLIEYRKGFMTFDSFWKAYDKLKDKDGKEMILHFRIGTHGGNVPSNTHPFPISDNVKDLKELSGTCKEIMMHNGVLPIEPRRKEISDTMELALRIAETGVGGREMMRFLSGFVNDRILVMDADGIESIGDWKKEDGVFYSNLNWKVVGYYRNCFPLWKKGGKDTKVTKDLKALPTNHCFWDDGDEFEESEPSIVELDNTWQELVRDGYSPSWQRFNDAVNDFVAYYGYYNMEEFLEWFEAMLDNDMPNAEGME